MEPVPTSTDSRHAEQNAIRGRNREWLGAGEERRVNLTGEVWKDFLEGVAVDLVCLWDGQDLNPG